MFLAVNTLAFSNLAKTKILSMASKGGLAVPKIAACVGSVIFLKARLPFFKTGRNSAALLIDLFPPAGG